MRPIPPLPPTARALPAAVRAAVLLAASLPLALAGCASLPQASATKPDPAATASVAAAAAAGAVAGAQSVPPPAAAPGAAPANPVAAAAAAGAAAATAAASATKPFAEVVKGAKEQKGLFTIYTKEDKVWLALLPGDFDKPLFLSVNLARGIGENWLFGGMMGNPSFVGGAQVVTWRKVGNNVQLIARNERFFARADTPEARSVADAFSDSLLGAAAVASQPDPATHAVLVELNALVLTDLPGANGMLERTYRQSYAFDVRNSAITRTHLTDDLLGVAVDAHYALARVTQPPVTPSPSYRAPPATLPDVRSLFLGFYYNFARLPEAPMQPRRADPRIGYFTASRYDYSNDGPLTPRTVYIKRWRLEKKDPAAALSEPKQPITYWLDRNIPIEYRDTIVAGVLEWNKAFEKIGFKDAVVVKVQPDDADFDTMDLRHASIRWMASAKPMFGGIGPSQVDPRTGEILDADILIDPVRIRNRRAAHDDLLRDSRLPGPVADTLFPQAFACLRQDLAAEEEGFALDLLEARGDIEPGSAAEQRFILDDLKDVVMHEVGHTLGLTHNFRASTIYSRAQLDDVAFTRAHGIAGSVMEYNAINIALPGEKQASYSMATLGPYDYWAIEYGYREFAPGDEKPGLAKIAARSTEPTLAYAYDEESATGLDPDAAISDLSNDPLAFAGRRMQLAGELWTRWEKRELPEGESLSRYRRNMTRGLNMTKDAGLAAARYIGGTSVLRDAAGSGRTPLNPVPPQKQREALKLIEKNLFSADSFRFEPAFLRKLSTDWLDRNDSFDVGLNTPGFAYSLPAQVLIVQRTVLDLVMSDAVAQRLLDSGSAVDRPAEALRVSELYASLHAAIFSELGSGRDITLLRRNLQREYTSNLVDVMLRPKPTTPPDVRAVARADARALRRDIIAAQGKQGFSPDARAHLAETLDTLDEALKASVIKSAM